MRISNVNLGSFVPGGWTIPENPITGLAAFSSARFTLPQNPVGLAALADFVGAHFTLPQNPVDLGDLVDAMYPIDQNSVLDAAHALGLGELGCGGDCGCGCAGSGMCGGGLGQTFTQDLSTAYTNFQTWATSTLGPNGMLYVGGAVALAVMFFMMSGKGGRRR